MTERFVQGISTKINNMYPIYYHEGTIYCICKYPDPIKTEYSELIQTNFKLKNVNIIFEGEIQKSTMDINEFRQFTKKRNIIFDANVLYDENKGWINAVDVTFIDSKLKKEYKTI